MEIGVCSRIMRSTWMTLGLTLLAPLAGMTQVSAESHNSAVYINVSVRNNGRLLLSPLKAENVRLKIGNRIVPVNRIEKDKAMRRIGIVLDSSGSMQFVEQSGWRLPR